jgi:hypothetical protein
MDGQEEAHTPEEIVAKLRQVEVLAAQGKAVAEAVRSIGVTEQTTGRAAAAEVFNTLREAQVLIERWRRHLQHVAARTARWAYRPPGREVSCWCFRCRRLALWSGRGGASLLSDAH